MSEEIVAAYSLEDFRAAVKHAANGDWEKLSQNTFFRAAGFATPVGEYPTTTNWARERAFFDQLERLCLGLIARADQGPTAADALVDACRFYAQAFMGEYVSGARLEKRFRGAERCPSGAKATSFAESVLVQIAEREPSLCSVNRTELLSDLCAPVSKDTFERSVRRALGRLFDAANDAGLPPDHNQRTDATSANGVGSPPLQPSESELWQRVATAMQERCAGFELGGRQFPIEASMPRHGWVVGRDGQQPIDTLAVLQPHARVMISAPPGGGLTTLAARVVTELDAHDPARLTIVISLAKYGAAIVRNGLLHTVAHEWWGTAQPHDAVPLEQLLAKLVQHDALNLVLDGWGEMAADPQAVRDALAPFRRYVCFAHTSPAQVHPTFDAQIALLPLTSSEMGRWFHDLARSGQAPFDETYLPLMFDLLARDALADLKGSEPSILDIALKLLRDGKKLLPTAALLWHYIERCLSNVHDLEHDSPAERTATRQWLGQLALWMVWGTPAIMKHRKEQTVWQVPARHLEPPFSAHRPPVYRTVPLARRQALAVRSGLLQEREAHTYAFSAPCIQQLLAAEALTSEPGYASELTAPEHRPVLLDMAWICAQSPGQAAALQDVIGNYQHPREHTHLDWMLFLAELLEQFDTGRGQTAWTRATRDLLEQKLVAVWQACAFTSEQVQLGRALARLGSEQAREACIQALDGHGDLLDSERIQLIRQLRHFCGKRAARLLAHMACDPANPDTVRAEAVQALCEMTTADGLVVLRELLHSGDAVQRAWLVERLKQSAAPVAGYGLLDSADAIAQGSEQLVSADCDAQDVLATLDPPGSGEGQLGSDLTRPPSQLSPWTDPARIQQAVALALHGTPSERKRAAEWLSRVPPTAEVPTALDWVTARQLLTVIESAAEVERRRAAYMLLKLCAPGELFPDLVRRAERAEPCRTFAARATTDILATRRFLCPVLEKRSGLEAVKLLLMLRFGFHIGLDYSIPRGGRTVFSRPDGRVHRTCMELAAAFRVKDNGQGALSNS